VTHAVALEIFDAAQRSAVELPLSGELVIVRGAAGSGKSRALAARALRALNETAARRIVISRAGGEPEALLAQIERLAPGAPGGRLRAGTFADLAKEILTEGHALGMLPAKPDFAAEAEAARLFESAAVQLLSLEWADLRSDEIDPEVTGLRAPEHFLAAAYRLIRKLRDALVDPGAFLEAARRGATEFYAHPPNFAGTDLLLATPAKYRASLKVDAAELERQYRREIDLAKILARLYAYYVERIATTGTLSGADAVVEAAALLRARDGFARELRERYVFAFVDDAEDLLPSELALLRALFGERLEGVTLGLNPEAALRTLRGARPKTIAALSGSTVQLEGSRRRPPEGGDVALRLHRAPSRAGELQFVAATVAAAIRDGCPPREIAVVARTLAGAAPLAEALLERDVPVDLCGDYRLGDDRTVADGLALLWSIADPFRHDWLLRVLQSPLVAFCDASLAALCAEPPNPQRALFALPEDSPVRATSRRTRLARNVLLGEADETLSADARERLAAFRALRRRWVAYSREIPPAQLAAAVLAESGVGAAAAGGARARFQAAMLGRLVDDIRAFERRNPLAPLGRYLEEAERTAAVDGNLPSLRAADPEAVTLATVDTIADREFEIVLVTQAQAGAFPRYYVPEAFLFSPAHGMIPKENVGDGAAGRTAKFTWYLHRAKAQALYVEEERRRFEVARARARRLVYVTAAGKPTRGASTPEFLSELIERTRQSSER
jgi:superfamily I DNA/RNA helicase